MNDLVVSHSRIKTWRACQRMHYYKYVERLVPRKKESPLFIGSAVHKFIEAYHERGSWKPELKEVSKEYDKLFSEEKELLGDIPAMCDALATNYFRTYRDDGLVYTQYDGKSTEIEVRAELAPGIEFLGYVDALPTDATGRTWVMDHKTCKAIPEEDARSFDVQLITYCWLVPASGIAKPRGVIWDYIRTKVPVEPKVLQDGSLSQAKNQDTTYEVYLDAIRKRKLDPNDYRGMLQYLQNKNDKFFHRVWLPKPSKVMMKNLITDLKSSAKQIHRYGEKRKTRSMGRQCTWCSYKTLCLTEFRGLDAEHLRKFDYTVKEKNDD